MGSKTEMKKSRSQAPPPAYTLRTTPDGIQTAKLWTRLLSAAICVVLFGASIKLEDVPGVIIILMAPAGITLMWDVAMILVRFLRRNSQDIHPGTRVGVDLVIWLGFGAVAVMMAATWSTWGSNMPEIERDGVKFVLVKVAVILATIEAFVHIVLFIIACHETHVRNRYKKLVRRVRGIQRHSPEDGSKEDIADRS